MRQPDIPDSPDNPDNPDSPDNPDNPTELASLMNIYIHSYDNPDSPDSPDNPNRHVYLHIFLYGEQTRAEQLFVPLLGTSDQAEIRLHQV